MRNEINGYWSGICKIKNYEVQTLPEKSKYNVSGLKCARLICNWNELIEKVPELEYTRIVMTRVKRIFAVLYTPEFDTFNLQLEKLWYIEHAEEYIHDFAILCEKFNYYSHCIGVHGPTILQNFGSIYKYCNDIQESIGYFVKNVFRIATNRKLDWTRQVLERSLLPILLSNIMGCPLVDLTKLESKEIISMFHKIY